MTIRQMLLICGLPDTVNAAGTRPTQAFIDSQGFTHVEDFTIISVKDVLNMINNHNSINGQIVILGYVHQRKLQVLIYWARYKKRHGMAIVAADWTTAQLVEAIERFNSDVPAKGLERPSKLDIGVKWNIWDTKWESYLGSLQGASVILVYYVDRCDMPATWNPATDAVNEHDRLKYQALLTGSSYETYRMNMYGELKACCLDSKGCAWIKRFDRQKDGHLAMKSLRAHY